MLREVPVSHVPGVGKVKAEALANLGISSVEDLLHDFPVRYEDRHLRSFSEFIDASNVTARAIVQGTPTIRWFQRRAMMTARLQVDGVHSVVAVWFNQPYLKGKLRDGQPVIVYGKYDAARNRIVVSKTDLSMGSRKPWASSWVPVYRTVQGLTSQQIQVFIERAMNKYGEELTERLPVELMQKYKLVPHGQAVRWMHEPESEESLRQAHRRLAFEEFFIFQLQLQWIRHSGEEQREGTGRRVADHAMEVFQGSLPSSLTSAQKRVCTEITVDLTSPRAMARLLQGDVGSGKTWVAFWAAYAAFTAHVQTAFMAPTEILAEQHFREASQRLGPLGMTVALLTGSTATQERTMILERTAGGEIDMLVGTHALLTQGVDFANLGLVVTDEQHRFGVSQRSILRQKGVTPDVLFLSATPIPRTLAMAVYGDLDVSVLDELPQGRIPIRTYHVDDERLPRALRFVRQQLTQGRQVYVVAPLIEESEELSDVSSATQLYSEMQEVFAGFPVSLLHGRMKSAEKEAVMRSFVAGETCVLVSTTVIEVGIHVPNATVMLIYHAERFGLAQLHQLRGRVGRGNQQSYCFLVSSQPSDLARERIETMTQTTDGFKIAERDLELRGPGELLGTRQSGLPEFTVGDLGRDLNIMEVARNEARTYIGNPDFWLLPKYRLLREAVEQETPGVHIRD